MGWGIAAFISLTSRPSSGRSSLTRQMDPKPEMTILWSGGMMVLLLK